MTNMKFGSPPPFKNYETMENQCSIPAVIRGAIEKA
jgi:hypothetical protein